MANCVYVMARMLHLYKFTISRHCRQAWKMSRYALRISRKLFLIGLNPGLFGDDLSLW